MMALVLFAAPVAAGQDEAALPAESAAMLERVNHERAAQDLPPLRGSSQLTRSALRQARWMLGNDILAHQPSIQVQGTYRSLGETLAWHSGRRPRVEATFRAWMRSAGHRSVLMSRSFRFLGVAQLSGRYRGSRTTAWVAQLGG